MKTAVVELYNIIERGRTVANGWLVANYIDGCRRDTIRKFSRDEAAARRFAARCNTPPDPHCEGCFGSGKRAYPGNLAWEFCTCVTDQTLA